MTDSNYRPDPDIYWAAEDSERIAAAVERQFERYQERVRETGRLRVWRTADRCYHGRNPDGGYATAHEVTFGGSQGEVAQLHVGHFRQIVGQQLILATEARPAIDVTAQTNDPEAISDTVVARQVLEYDLDEAGGGLEADLARTHEKALTASEGYLVQVWDFYAGEPTGTRAVPPEAVDTTDVEGLPGTETPEGEAAAQIEGVDVATYEGAIRVIVRHPIDVARDLDLDETADPPWYIVRTRAHRWELAARFPESAEIRRAILDAPPATADEWTLQTKKPSDSDSDYVCMLTLYHPPSPALPNGRLVEVVGGQRVSPEADPYPFDHMVVHPDIPSAEEGAAQGYGDAWDMLAPSQALDAVESGMLSVADAGALVRYVAPRGQHVDVRQLDTGLSLTEYDDDGRGQKPPGLMERPEVRDSERALSEHYRSTLEMLSGVSATIRGAADDAKSGADRALIATMAVRANSKHQKAYAKLLRSVLNARVALYRMFLGEERTIEMAGRDKSQHVRTFSARTLSNVRRVRVDLGPPELRTTEGKLSLADKMLEMYGPDVITPHKYMALRTLGRLDDIDDAVAEHKAIARRENDLFREGKGQSVQAMMYHHHQCHIAEHVRDLTNADLVYDPTRTQEIITRLAHVMAHVQMWPQTPPEILAATGQEPAPSTLMGAPPGGAPPPGPMPPQPGGDAPPMLPPQGAGGGPNGPAMPQMPMVPGTGQRFDPAMPPPGGGGAA